MRSRKRFALGLALLLGGAMSAQAQNSPAPLPQMVNPASAVYMVPGNAAVPSQPSLGSGAGQRGATLPAVPSGAVIVDQPNDSTPVLPAPSVPMNQADAPPVVIVEDSAPMGDGGMPMGDCDTLGPTAPEDVKLLQQAFGLSDCACGVRVYGWMDMGYNYASSGPGLLTVEPRENRYGNEFLLNQLGLVIDKPLKNEGFNLGFNMTFWAGADAALLRPEGGFTTTDSRFGADFRQLYVAAHLPILTEGGVDVKFGCMNTVIGYESALAPYRPFYSNDYQWFYAQDGAFTGITANWHVNPQLDILSGITMGANTFFTFRGDGPCYLGQVNYWTSQEKNTLLSASIYLGNNAIFAAPGLAGDFDTTIELRVQHNWSKWLTQIVQSDMGWDSHTPCGTGQWYGLYTILVYHLTPCLDLNARNEWFDDVHGTRTGFATNYNETTLGFDYHPKKCLSIRPEVRGDFAEDPVWRNGRDKSQLTAAVDVLLKF